MVNLKQFSSITSLHVTTYQFSKKIWHHNLGICIVKVTIQRLSQILLQMWQFLHLSTCILDLLRAKWCNSLPKNSPIISAPHMTFSPPYANVYPVILYTKRGLCNLATTTRLALKVVAKVHAKRSTQMRLSNAILWKNPIFILPMQSRNTKAIC